MMLRFFFLGSFLCIKKLSQVKNDEKSRQNFVYDPRKESFQKKRNVMPCALMYSFKQKKKYEHVLGAKTENFSEYNS